ncbi:MAG: DUF4835 family protein [Cyclobacteriaceae bacterium]|nr:MAG: DUF4835 family protein [Cyclobacteriaceae bacterium]
MDHLPQRHFRNFFFDAKSNELVSVFSDGSLNVRREAYDILTTIDPKRNIYQKSSATNTICRG